MGTVTKIFTYFYLSLPFMGEINTRIVRQESQTIKSTFIGTVLRVMYSTKRSLNRIEKDGIHT